MKDVTTVFPVNDKGIYLARKKLAYRCPGYYNGYGGHKEEYDADIKDCALREFREESGATVESSSLQMVAVIDFFELNRGELCRNHVFLTQKWNGDFGETEEMYSPEFFPKNRLPLGDMWPADRLWLPLVLFGCVFRDSSIVYRKGRKSIQYHDLRAYFVSNISS